MIPDNVEKIIMTKEDYDRNVEQLLVEKLELEQELQRKDNNWNELKKFLIDLQELKGINQQGFSWGVCQEVLDKIKELEESNENRKCS